MANVFEIASRNIEDVIQSLPSIISQAIARHDDEFIDLNTSQLEEGKLSTGQNISPNYVSNEYAQFKKAIGSKSSPVPDLKVEGNFYKNFYLKMSGKNIAIGSDDEKAAKLTREYTDNIYGIAPKNYPTAKDIIFENVKKQVHEKLKRR